MATFINNAEAVESAFEGCPDPTSGRAIIIRSGMTIVGDSEGGPRICHQLRDQAGLPIDLSAYDPANGENDFTPKIENGIDSVALFRNALCNSGLPQTSAVEIADAEEGRVCVKVPAHIADNAGIYQIEFVIADTAGRPAIQDTTLLSVERSMLSDLSVTNKPAGPLTLGEIRMQLRDFAGLNTAWENAEFSDAEIIHSILLPIQVFNETLPSVLRYTAANFPWRYNWLEGATANLLRLAANWYLRNSQRISYGDNKTEDDKDKFGAYLQLAEAKWRQYLQFCEQQQIVANLRGFSRT